MCTSSSLHLHYVMSLTPAHGKYIESAFPHQLIFSMLAYNIYKYPRKVHLKYVVVCLANAPTAGSDLASAAFAKHRKYE